MTPRTLLRAMSTVYDFKVGLTSTHLIILLSFFLTVFSNISFYSHVLDVYPLTLRNSGFLVSLALVFAGLTVFLLSLVCYKYTIKPVAMTILILSSFASYFMDSYNVIIDEAMIRNIVSTDINESLDLFSEKMIVYVLLLGVLPSFFIYKIKMVYRSGYHEFISRIKLLAVVVIGVVVIIFSFSDFYSSFIRANKFLRSYANPVYYVYSTGKYIDASYNSKFLELTSIGLDANTPALDQHRELVIMVVGETARSDRFSLNGYARETNPLLKKENVISFTNYWSCGTSTAVSVPCMFSMYGSDDFNNEKGQSTENVLDVLKHAGVNLLWLDNNSSSKGVADRISYKSYKNSDINSLCDPECRDEGMLLNIQDYISKHPQGDIFIVLHQLGNHGPAYYKRYPANFEKFTPACRTNQLENCSKEEINNAYDNAILYTDYFLHKVIALLKENDSSFETAMYYVSDHGESLGENELYLHGLPNFIAPDSQRHVPAIIWLGENFDEDQVNFKELSKRRNNKYTHDNVFHTILGFMEIETSIYDKSMDILH